MKKIFLTLFVLATVLTMSAVTPANFKIYINPGHGGWGPNDRPYATVPYPALSSTGRPDTCGFYESNTDLWKTFGLYDELQKVGVKSSNVKFSRVKNGPYPYKATGTADYEYKYNKKLGVICTEVNEFKPNMFISIHSNAADSKSTNYTIYLYRGWDGSGGDKVSGSRAMSQACWNYGGSTNGNKLDWTSNKNTQVRGDLTFYGSSSTVGYLGVLKHSYPGFLVEGHFFTYQPAAHRCLNQDYCRQEGVRYARGIMDYFGLGQTGKGVIMGAVKDNNQSVSSSLYTYNTGADKNGNYPYDNKKPVHGARVELYNSSGTCINTYTTDNLYNGVFVFKDLTPGSYSVKTIKSGYADQTKSVTVSANATQYPIFLLNSGTSGSTTDPEDPEEPQPDPDPEPDPSTFERTGSLEFTQEARYYGSNYGVTMSGTVISSAQYGEKTVLLTDVPNLYVIDNASKQVATLSIAGITGQGGAVMHPLKAIAFTDDGTLVGCNKTVNQESDEYVTELSSGQRGTQQYYYWPSLEAGTAPVQWFSTQAAGYYYEAMMGDAIAVKGTFDNATVFTTARTLRGSQNEVRYQASTVSNGTVTKTVFMEAPSVSTQETIGSASHISIDVSPRDASNLIIDGTGIKPVEYYMPVVATADGEKGTPAQVGAFDAASLNATSNHNAFIAFGENKLMVAPINSTAGTNTGLFVYNITSGLAQATLYSTSNTDLNEATPTYIAAHAAVVDDQLILYLVKDFTVVKFAQNTMSGVSGEPTRGIFAYGLTMDYDEAEDTYTFSYGANNSSVAGGAKVIFTDAATGEETGRLAIPDAKMTRQDLPNGRLDAASGEYTIAPFNTFSLTGDQIPGNDGTRTLAWSIQLQGREITQSGVRLTSPKDKYKNINGNADGTAPDGKPTYKRILVAVDNSPESDFFGSVYVNNNMDVQTGDPCWGNGVTRWLQGHSETYTDAGTTSNWSDYMRWVWVPANSENYTDEKTPKFSYRATGTSLYGNHFRDNMGLAVDYLGNVWVGEHTDHTGSQYGNIVRMEAADMAHDHDAKAQFFYYGQDKSVSGSPASDVSVTDGGLWMTTDGKKYGSSVGGVAISGRGENTILAAAVQDFGVNNATGSSYGDVAIYRIGMAGNNGSATDTLKTFWGNADGYPTMVLALGSTSDISRNRRLQGDDKGGLWVSTHRNDGNNTEELPTLMYVSAHQIATATNFNEAGRITPQNVIYNNGRLPAGTFGRMGGCKGGGFAVSPDNSLLAINNASGYVLLYDITWSVDDEGNDVPTLTLRSGTDQGLNLQRFKCDSVEANNNAIYQMAFDWGNNLYAGSSSLVVYSVVDKTNNTHVTPAKAGYAITPKKQKNGPDVNRDGQVTVTDVTAVYDCILGTSNTYEATADVNGDGQITVTDVTYIYNYILGLTQE